MVSQVLHKRDRPTDPWGSGNQCGWEEDFSSQYGLVWCDPGDLMRGHSVSGHGRIQLEWPALGIILESAAQHLQQGSDHPFSLTI